MKKQSFQSIDQVMESLQPGFAVVLVRQEDGSFVFYDVPKSKIHPYESHLLACNLAGAQVIHGEAAFLFPANAGN